MRASEDQLRAWMVDGLDGNASAHAALLGALVPVLRAYCRRRVSDDAAIEDIVQDTLIAVHTRRMTYDRDRLFTVWLFAIARYKMVDYFRRTRQNCPIEDVEHLLVSPGFEDAVGARIDIDDLLDHLPAKQAKLIRRTRLHGHSIADTALAEGLGESDVKVSIHRGLKVLAARIRGQRR